MKFINMAAGRFGAGQYDASKYYCIARTIEGAPKTVKIISTSSSLSSPTEIKTYDEVQPMLMNANTRIVTTKLNGNAYYDYDNKIYHWAMTGVDPVVPAEGAKPDITLPDGEQIMDICTNAVPSTSSAVVDDDQLLIATYNPTATGRKPRQPLRLQSEDDGKGEGVCRHLRKTRGRGLQVPHIELDDPPGTARSASGLPLAGGPDRFSGTARGVIARFRFAEKKKPVIFVCRPHKTALRRLPDRTPSGQSHPFSRGGGGGRGIICAET